MISLKSKEAAMKIGRYYLQKNLDNYEEAEKEIRLLQIKKVEALNEDVIITTSRPGILIGSKGRNIEALQAYFAPVRILIKEDEDCLDDFLIPREPIDLDLDVDLDSYFF